ncbi:hypothetical protein BYT27DRAFT_7333574 [Phlegmacium glaucopus]|nr:hypothetical protein BYT27DRAFT_7333574 [Phlegmacium glaucopus]
MSGKSWAGTCSHIIEVDTVKERGGSLKRLDLGYFLFFYRKPRPSKRSNDMRQVYVTCTIDKLFLLKRWLFSPHQLDLPFKLIIYHLPEGTGKEQDGFPRLSYSDRRLPRWSTRRIMGKFRFFSTSTQSITRAVLSGDVSRANWDRLENYARKVKVFKAMPSDTKGPKVVPPTYIRIAQLQSSALFPSLRHLCCSLEAGSTSHVFLFLSPSLELLELTNTAGSENTLLGLVLDTLASPMLKRIVLRNGWLSCSTLESIAQFRQLRSLELAPSDTVYDPASWEVIGTLPFLVNLTLKVINSQAERQPHWGYTWEGSNNKSGGPKCFNALETLHITTFFPLILHLLNLIESPCLNSIEIHPAIEWELVKDNCERGRLEKDFLDAIAMVGSKWLQSLEKFVIGQHSVGDAEQFQLHFYHTFSNSITKFLTDLHGMQS